MQRICLVGERGRTIRSRLSLADDFRPGHIQIPYYIPKEDDVNALASRLSAIAKADGVDVVVHWVDAPCDVSALLQMISADTVFVILTDGNAPFSGTPLSGLLRTFGGRVFGSGATASACSQDKFLQYRLFKSLDITTPQSWSRALPSPSIHPINGYFVKPCGLGNSIGIFDDAYGCDWPQALAIANRIEDIYGMKAIIQEYITGLYCRASFIGCHGNPPSLDDVGLHALILPKTGSRSAFKTFDQYYEQYVDDDKTYNMKVASISLDLCLTQELVSAEAVRKLQIHLDSLISQLDLSGIFTIDIIINDDNPYFLEVNTNPFLRNAALRSYTMEHFGVDAETAFYSAVKGATGEC